ncbi:unnamed protein product, partial [Polarella glacialis]
VNLSPAHFASLTSEAAVPAEAKPDGARRRRRQAPMGLKLTGDVVEAMDSMGSPTTRQEYAFRGELAQSHFSEVLCVILLLVVVYGAAQLFMTSKAEPKEGEEGTIREVLVAAQESASSGDDSAVADLEALLQTLTQTVAQKLGPKAAKGQAVRSILESRLYEFPDKAKAFVMNELNGTAGALLKAVEAEEAMMLLDLDKAISSSFPPISTLLAGLVSPTILSFSSSALMAQLIIVILPLLAMSSWSIYEDYGVFCAIPTMTLWVKTQFGISLFLGISNFMVVRTISSGKQALDAKTESMQDRIKDIKERSATSGMGASEFRELFVCNSVLIEEALLLEDSVKASFWFNASGAGTVAWILTTIWTFVIVLGWTFVPGIIAFSKEAENSAHYCGTWATVFTARISCVLAVLFLIVNIFTIVNWLATVLMRSQSFSVNVLASAKKFDRKGLGFPVAELLVKAFLLRGSSDTMGAQLNIAMADQVQMERQRDELKAKIASLDGSIKSRAAEVEAIKVKAAEIQAKGASDPMGVEASITQLQTTDIDVMGQEWKELGSTAVADAEARASATMKATSEELERLMSKFSALAEGIQQSETFKSVAAQAQVAAAQAQQAAEAGLDSAAQAQAEMMRSGPGALQAALEQARAQASSAAAQASSMASELQSSEMLQASLQQAQTAAGQMSETASTLADRTLQQTEAAQAAAQAALEKDIARK